MARMGNFDYRRVRHLADRMPQDKRSVYLRGFPYDMDLEKIRDFFHDRYGKCNFVFNKPSSDRQFWFLALRFEDDETAEEVMENHDGKEVLGYKIQCTEFQDHSRARAIVSQEMFRGGPPPFFGRGGGRGGMPPPFFHQRRFSPYRPRRHSQSRSRSRTRSRSRSRERPSRYSGSFRGRSNSRFSGSPSRSNSRAGSYSPPPPRSPPRRRRSISMSASPVARSASPHSPKLKRVKKRGEPRTPSRSPSVSKIPTPPLPVLAPPTRKKKGDHDSAEEGEVDDFTTKLAAAKTGPISLSLRKSPAAKLTLPPELEQDEEPARLPPPPSHRQPPPPPPIATKATPNGGTQLDSETVEKHERFAMEKIAMDLESPLEQYDSNMHMYVEPVKMKKKKKSKVLKPIKTPAMEERPYSGDESLQPPRRHQAPRPVAPPIQQTPLANQLAAAEHQMHHSAADTSREDTMYSLKNIETVVAKKLEMTKKFEDQAKTVASVTKLFIATDPSMAPQLKELMRQSLSNLTDKYMDEIDSHLKNG